MTTENNTFYFLKSITDDDHIKITIPLGAYEIESLNNEIKRIIIDQEYYTETNYPFNIKPNFSTLGSIIEISTQGPAITFAPDNSMGDLLGFNKTNLKNIIYHSILLIFYHLIIFSLNVISLRG